MFKFKNYRKSTFLRKIVVNLIVHKIFLVLRKLPQRKWTFKRILDGNKQIIKQTKQSL